MLYTLYLTKFGIPVALEAFIQPLGARVKHTTRVKVRLCFFCRVQYNSVCTIRGH